MKSLEERQALKELRSELAKFHNGETCNITKEMFLHFVERGPYTKLWQVEQQVRDRLVEWAKKSRLGLELFLSWLPEAEGLQPGFFDYPEPDPANSNDNIFKDFDYYLELGIANHPPCPPSPSPQPSITSTHYPNGKNSLPESVTKSRPELAGKTREEAWLFDLDKCEEFYTRLRGWCQQSVESIEGEGCVEDTFKARFWQIFSLLPNLAVKKNAAQACIEEDRKQSHRQAQARDFINRGGVPPIPCPESPPLNPSALSPVRKRKRDMENSESLDKDSNDSINKVSGRSEKRKACFDIQASSESDVDQSIQTNPIVDNAGEPRFVRLSPVDPPTCTKSQPRPRPVGHNNAGDKLREREKNKNSQLSPVGSNSRNSALNNMDPPTFRSYLKGVVAGVKASNDDGLNRNITSKERPPRPAIEERPRRVSSNTSGIRSSIKNGNTEAGV